MERRAKGEFDVRIAPIAEGRQIAGFSRMTIDKTIRGDLEATSKGEMLSAGNPGAGSAGYVALERVEGTLAGKRGSFFLQHRGVMAPAGQELLVTIVPGSGTEDLAGISGAFAIAIDRSGKHFYDLTYSLPE